MAMPTSAQQALAKLRQGPVHISVDPDGDDVELYLRDGLDLTYLRGIEEASVDLVGVYSLFSSGDGAEFEVNVPEMSVNALAVIYADCVTDSTSYVGLGRTAGNDLRDIAKAWRIRPWQTRTVSTTQVELWKVVPSGDGSLTMGVTDPWQFTQSFRALPDLSKADGQLIGKISVPIRA